MEIVAPKEFRNALRNLGQGLLKDIESLDHMAQVVLIGVGQVEGEIIRKFIDRVLIENHDAESLKEFWLDTPASIYFDDGKDVEVLLEAIRKHLQRPPYVTVPG
jgi:hypothetical protein